MAHSSGYLVGTHESQIDAVLDLLLSGEKLTHLTAHHLVGTISLQLHVFKLREQGYPIRTKMKQAIDGRRYAEYHMDRDALQRQMRAGGLS